MSSHNHVVSGFQAGHIGLNVSNVNRSKEFYQKVFGFDVVRESHEVGREFVLLGTNNTPLVTLWQQSSGTFAKDVPGLHHLAFQVNSMEDVHHVEETLREMKAQFIYDGIVPHSEGTQSGGIFFQDPDGIRLEIFTPQGAAEYEAPSHGPSCGFF